MIVLTIGTFDMLHPGHLDLLRACRGIAGPHGQVVVAVNPDAFVERFKGRRPVQPLADRMEMLRACTGVDAVVVNLGEAQASTVIDVVRPDTLVIGDDWKDRDYLGQLGIDRDWLADRGLRIYYVSRDRPHSSTSLKAAVFENAPQLRPLTAAG